MGGNLIDYLGHVSTPKSDLTTLELLLNRTISTTGARFMMGDNTLLKRYEYMRLALNLIPEEMILHYKLLDIAEDRYIYFEIWKGMYGLPQANMLVNNQLTKHLATYGYSPTTHTPGLWQHQAHPIYFTLVVDSFGVKYFF